MYFMGVSEEYKQLFYEWIVAKKRQEYIESYNIMNPVLHTELKHYIFDHILSDKSLLNCDCITPK